MSGKQVIPLFKVVQRGFLPHRGALDVLSREVEGTDDRTTLEIQEHQHRCALKRWIFDWEGCASSCGDREQYGGNRYWGQEECRPIICRPHGNRITAMSGVASATYPDRHIRH